MIVFRLLWRFVRGVLLVLAAIVLFIEEWGWQPLSAWAARLTRWPPLAGLHKRRMWLAYAEVLVRQETVRCAAETCEIDTTTSFHWRHCFLQIDAVRRQAEGVARHPHSWPAYQRLASIKRDC